MTVVFRDLIRVRVSAPWLVPSSLRKEVAYARVVFLTIIARSIAELRDNLMSGEARETNDHEVRGDHV